MLETKRKLAESSTATQSDTSETTSPSRRSMSPPIAALWSKLGGNPFAATFNKWVREAPDAEAVVWLNGEGDVAEIRTYKQLVDQIYTLAAHLEEIGIKKNDRVILCYPPGIDFIVAFYSCIISGIAAVPVYPPDPTKGVTDIPRFCDIGASAGTKKALTSTTYRRVAAAMSVVSRERRWKEIEWICTDTIKTKATAANCPPATLDPHSIAFLQFTSGSTSEPKGVMVTHASLLHNMHLCWHSFEFPTHLETKDPNEQFSTHDYDFFELDEFWKRRHEVSMARKGHRVRAFSWLPVYHDMGLIGFVCCPLFCGAALYQMSPIDFIRRPWVWLKALSQYECVCSAAPNFAFGLVTRKMPDNVYNQLDLSHVTGILSGAEPVRRQTVEQFVEKFGPKGIKPCTVAPAYGLAEHTLIVTGRGDWQTSATILYVDALKLRAERIVRIFTPEEAASKPAGDVQDVVSCGFPFKGVTVKIVDPETDQELPDGHVGEIIAFSESVALGYFNKPEQTSQTFHVSVKDAKGNSTPASGLRTGDCGFMYNGELYVTGRFKDIIIIRGRNYYPSDIEEAILEVPQIRPGCVAAFAIEADSNEVLGIAAELRVEDGLKGVWARVRRQLFDRSSYDQIVKNICRTVATSTGLSVHRVWLLRPRSLPKTSSGKLRRSLAREKLLEVSNAARAGTQAPLKSPTQQPCEAGHKGHDESGPTHEAIVKAVREAVIDAAKNVLGDDGELPDMQAPLHELGVDSIAAVELAELVSERLNIDIEPTLMFNYPTMEDIMEFLVREIEGKGAEEALTINTNTTDTTMAVVGAACNLPGGSTTLSSFWDALMCGVDAMVEVPRSRWDVEDYFDPDPDAEGKMYIREGGFIENAEFFDASFFRISLAEASSMDPQQRLLLEVGYEALHDSGFDKETLLRANIGTFVGCCCNEWQQTCAQMGLGISSFTATSHAPSILSNRISYTLGMLGPSLTVDTACSSSLVALHIAIQELKAGSCSCALVAGVNLMLSPNVTVAFCKARMMAPDARCKTFDASANGYVRGEGLGAIVIKPHTEAMKDSSRILCIVRGTAVNHGGRAASLTAPSGPSQERIIRTALRNASVAPDEVLFVETHGTGTPLGDPIEIGALKSVFRSSRDSPLLLGAVKTNIGHLEGAAGIAGFLKAALALRYEQMPPNLHFKTWNPHIDLKGAKFVCPVVALPITPATGKPRIGGVSSFGFGGANAHVLLQEAPHPCVGRRPYKAQKPTLVCFMFGSQGVESLQKCRMLYDSDPAFAKALNECGDILKRLVSVPLLSILFSEQDLPRSGERAHGKQSQQWLRQTRFADPALFSFEYAIGRSLISQGVKPDAVMGIGVGEFVAAAIAGVMSLEDGLRVACQRAKLVDTFLPADAVAAACRVGEKDVEMAISDAGGAAGSTSSVAISVVYGQKQLVLSGVQSELESVLMKLDIAGRFKYLPDRLSFSSPLLSDVVTPLARIIGNVKLSRPTIKMICATTGEFCDEQVLSAHYWTRHLIRTVRLDQCISNLVSAGCKLLVEINGRAALIKMGQQSVDEMAKDVEWVFAFPAAEEETSERQASIVQNCLAVMDRVGEQLEMEHGLHGQDELIYHRKPIPWVQIPHPLVGKHRKLGDGEFLFETSFPRRAVPLFADHMVNGKAMMPGMGMAEIVASAAFALDLKTPSGAVALENAFFERPMMIGSQRVTYEFNTRAGSRNCGRLSPRTVRTPRRVNDAYVRRPRADSDSRGFSTPALASPSLAPSTWLVSPVSSKESTPKLASSDPRSKDMKLKVELEEVTQSLLSSRGALPDDQVVPQDVEMTIRCHIMKNLNVELSSVWDDETNVHCSARIVLGEQNKEDATPSLKELQARCNQPVSIGQLYESLFDLGLQYGPRFRSVHSISRSESEALARLMLPEGCKQDSFESGFLVHPALLDGALHVAAALIGRHASRAHVSMVPVGAGRIWLRKLEGKAGCWAHVELVECRSRSAVVNVRIFDDSWQTVAALEKVALRNIDIGGSVGASIPRDLIWKVRWDKRAELTTQTQDHAVGKGPVLVLGGSLQLMEALSNALGGDDYGRVLSVEDIPSTRSKVQELLTSGRWRAIAFVEALTADEYAALDVPHAAIRLLQAYAALLNNGATMPPMWFFTSDIMESPIKEEQTPPQPDLPAHGGLWGLVKAARLEIEVSIGSTTQIGCLDIAHFEKDDDMAKAVVTFLRSSMATSDENELMLRGNTLYAARIEKSDLAVRGALELYMPERGAISNLVVRPQAFAARVPPEHNQVEVRVRAVGLNFRDVLNVMDLYPGDPGPPGADFAGTVVAVGDEVEHVRVGDRVYGIAPGALRTYATTDANLVRRAPSSLGFEESAALPVIAATVEYAFGDLAHVKAGDKVLVHTATGGVGLLAIQYCQRVGATVYATCSGGAKEEYLRSAGIQYITTSRDAATFAKDMREFLGPDGHVDVVLNTLVDDYIPESLKLLGPNGRFMELGKRGIWTREQVKEARPDVMYETIAVDTMMEEDPAWFGGMLDRIRESVESGRLSSLPLKVFDMEDPVEGGVAAFRYLQRAQHIGKVIIRMRSALQPSGGSSTETPADVPASPTALKTTSEADKSYVISGGHGALGLVVCKMLIEEGARHIALLSRSGEPSAELKEGETWQYLLSAQPNIQIKHVKCDMSKKEDVRKAFEEIQSGEWPPVRGIFHAAGVTDDKALAEQDKASIEKVYGPKVLGAWNLHEVCEELDLNKDLEIFLMFSSVAALLGNFGQANYAAANSCLDALTSWRRSIGLCGQSIQWGPWVEQGMAAGLRQHLDKAGMMGISNELGTRILQDVLKSPGQAVICAQALMWRKFLRRYAFDPPPFFSDVSTVTAVTFNNTIDLNSISKGALVEILVDVAQAVSGSAEKPNATTPLIDLGLDSLGAVEFRNSVAEKTGVKLPQNLMFENPSVEDIAEYILNRAKSPDGASGTRGTLVDTLQISIDQWLMAVLVPAERYALYVDSLTSAYGSLSDMAAVEDIVGALEKLEVTASEDFDRLNVAWQELRDAYANRAEATAAVKRKPRLAVRVPHPTEDVDSLISQLTFDVQALEPPTSPENYRTALLTGATGFVGRIQLSVLLEASDKLEVVCIVRAKDANHALDRIRQACKEAKCWKEEYCSRICPLSGDFTLPNLGLGEEKFEELSKRVDVVYHTGGDVNLLSNYARLRSSNVLCISGVIDFCTKNKLKPLHFASTLGQFPAFFCEFTGAYENYRITEDSRPTVEEMDAFYPPLRMGYPWSKWAAELVLCSAREKGLPVFLYRLPNTYVAYSTGYTNRTDYATALMISTIQEGIFPVGCAAAPLTPVDIICEMLVGVSFLKKPKHFVYHLFDPRAITREHLEVWSQELGLAYKGASVDEFLAAVKARGPESPVFKFVPLMQFMRKYWFDSEQRTDDFPIETKNIFDELPDAKWPDQRDVFKNSLLYSVQSGFFPKNSKAIRVDPEACLEDAKKLSGLDTLGEDHDYFMNPLRILKDSLLQESNPSFCGKLAMFRTVRQQLMNLMYMEKMRHQHPEIEQQEIKEPLIIVGLNRTGTTFLQNIMATDISNRSARYCEMIAPYGNNGEYCQKGLSNDPESWKHDPRIKFAQEVLDSQLALSEEWISIHAQSAELPEEDFVILEHCGRCYSICTEFNVPSYRKWLYANDFQEMKNAYKFHKRFLQHLQYQRVADRWLLKMPFHLFTLDALFETYPDARIIFMHRDPKDTLASWASLVRCAQQSLLDSVNPAELGKLELEAMSSMINRALEFRSSRPDLEGQILDVQYKDLIEDPLGTVSKIYSHFNIPLTEQARLRMAEFYQEDKKTRNKLSKHQYTLQDVSLTKAMVEEAFDQYYKSGLCKYLKK